MVVALCACTGSIKGGPPGIGTGVGAGSGSGTGTGGSGGPTGTAGSTGADVLGWTTRFPRLSHPQWENTTQDLFLLGATTGLSGAFTPDPATRFDTDVVQRKIAANLWSDYQTAAETLAQQVVADPAKLAKILPATLPADVAQRGRAFITAFGRRAFRRPMTADELTAYGALFDQGGVLLGGDPFKNGVEVVLRAILQSPQFLYRIESSETVKAGKIWLSGYEVASRLSYTLWNTMPSDALLTAAGAGELDTPAGVAKWTATMLDDPRASQTLIAFHQQLFRVSLYGSTGKDPTLFPTFTADLAPTLQEEARLFFDEVAVKQGGGIGQVLTTPVTFVNNKTAGFYGLSPAAYGPTLQKADLDPQRRAGLLTQLGFLSKNGGLAESDPIHRGVLINFNLLCVQLNPPPNGVPPLPAQAPGQTNRQRIEQHTNTCGKGCHDVVINPIGFAFEHYDAIGAWRDTDNGAPVDAKATYPLDGAQVSFDGAVELSKLLAKSPTVHHCYASEWLEFALGRPPAATENGLIQTIADASNTGGSAKTLLGKITAQDAFRARATEAAAP
jgi:hypothetical protein